jgi:hypothetical protein
MASIQKTSKEAMTNTRRREVSGRALIEAAERERIFMIYLLSRSDSCAWGNSSVAHVGKRINQCRRGESVRELKARLGAVNPGLIFDGINDETKPMG